MNPTNPEPNSQAAAEIGTAETGPLTDRRREPGLRHVDSNPGAEALCDTCYIIVSPHYAALYAAVAVEFNLPLISDDFVFKAANLRIPVLSLSELYP